ncbi:BON domain-containing protein [Vicingaceae bacterium]|nr:BON domain-containing protein [Vicingaceae bacterium]
MSISKQTRVDYPDLDVQNRVTSFLNSRHYPSFKKLHVEVDNGLVTVTGKLTTYYEKQVALNTCQRVAGVLSLIDEIDVS